MTISPLLTTAMLVGTACGLRVPVAGAQLQQFATSPMMAMRTSVPTMGMFDDLKRAAGALPIQQMIDQRVAKVSHILMKPGGPMTIQEARAQFDEWKAEIGGDPEKFAEVARRVSECEVSREKGGDLGYVTRLKQLPLQLDEVVFVPNPVPGVYGPIGSTKGLHLVYLHSCGEPMGRTEALFDPPNSLKKMMDTNNN
jgi:hypothetical protein